jgi:hypothetical protein
MLVSGLPIAAMANRIFAGVIVYGRPPAWPRARAATRPARVRSVINSRSNSAATAEPPTTVSIGDVLHAAELLSKQTAFEELSDDEQQTLRRALRRPLYRLRCKLAAFNIQIGTISSNDGCVIAFLLLFPEGELNGFRCDPEGGHTSQEVSANR